MNKQTYTFSYLLYDDKNTLLKEGKVRLKNKYSELDAKISADTNLRKLYPAMKSLVLKPELPENPFEDIFGWKFK